MQQSPRANAINSAQTGLTGSQNRSRRFHMLRTKTGSTGFQTDLTGLPIQTAQNPKMTGVIERQDPSPTMIEEGREGCVG
jgi:hypothetical protein